jgi:N-acetylmuramoyl-L-alanine amidase
MIGHFSRRRELRMKQAIFRGVYEENLRILGRTSARQYVRARLPRAARAALFATTFLGVMSFTGTSFSPQFFPEQQIQARYVPPAAPPAAPAAAAPGRAPSLDAALFQGERGLGLSRMLGLGVKTILIDPGHGGDDSGALGHGGTREKDVALDIARRLKHRLERDGKAEVLLTRDGDTTLPLAERVAIAQASHADLFVSVHLNFLPQKPINIIETFYFGPSRDAKTADLAKRENGGDGPGMSAFRELLERMGLTMKLEESRALAAAIQSSLFRNSRRSDAAVQDFGTKRAPFFVLLGAEVPAVLAEVSCLSNPQEEARLGAAEHREDIAAYLETGILDYLRNRETTYESKK